MTELTMTRDSQTDTSTATSPTVAPMAVHGGRRFGAATVRSWAEVSRIIGGMRSLE